MRMPKSLHHKKVDAFTLTEVLVVLVIIGILVGMIAPSMMSMTTRAKTVEAKTHLTYLHSLEQSYFYENSKYAKELSDVGFVQEKLVTDDKDARGNYRIEITDATNTTFKARATSVTDFDGDGIFNVWEIDQDKKLKEVTPD